MNRRSRRGAAWAGALFLAPMQAAAQTTEPDPFFESDPSTSTEAQPTDPPSSIPLQWSARVGGWTHDRDFPDGAVTAAAIHLRTEPRLSDEFDLRLEGWGQVNSSPDAEVDLREGWVRFSRGALDLRWGRQVVAWGRADGLNPTDVVGARDYTRTLVSDDEQRLGLVTAQARATVGGWTATALWLPEFRGNRFPVERGRPGVLILPDQRRRNLGQFALKLDRTGSALDVSVSYFRGIDRTRDLVLVPSSPSAGPVIAVQQQFPAIEVFGADMAGAVGRFGLRAEIAYTRVRGPDTVFRKNDNLWLVAGADTKLPSGWSVNLQYSFRLVFEFRDPRLLPPGPAQAVARQSAAVTNQLDERQSGFTFRVARSWMNDALSFDASAIGFVETDDVAVRPRLVYAIDDQVRAVVGADLFAGPRESFFGRVRGLSAAYVQLIAGF